MATYTITNEAGEVVNRVVLAPEKVSDALKPGETATMESEKDMPDHQAFRALRKERDRLLALCDWTLVSDAPTDKLAWAAYRQCLRDLPETVADPHDPVWPTPPN